MTIIPLGKVEIQVERQGTRQEYVEQLQTWRHGIIGQVVTRCLEAALEAEVTELLGREPYQRRARVARKVTKAQCNRCQTRAAWQFSRNGHYPRQLSTQWGQIELQMPQLTCECGGSVKVNYQTIHPRQRIWDDVAGEIRERYGWGESLRTIKASLERRLGSALGLRTLNERVHQLTTLVKTWQHMQHPACPPVVRLDGVWIPQMIATGEQRSDALGRLRDVKTGV